MQHLTEEKLGEECRELYRLALLKGEGQLTAESRMSQYFNRFSPYLNEAGRVQEKAHIPYDSLDSPWVIEKKKRAVALFFFLVSP